MDKLISWWHDHEPREQMFIALGGGAAAIVLLILFVIFPVMDWHAEEEKRLLQAQDDLKEVKSLVAQVQSKKKAGNTGKQAKSLAVLIDQGIRKNDLVMRGFQPGARKDARLRVENAPYPALAQWLYELEYQQKLTIEDLSLTPSNLAGRLMVSLRVSE